MGIHEGHALGEAAAPAFGRTVNVGADTERNVANMPLRAAPADRPAARRDPERHRMPACSLAIRRTCSW